MLTPQVVLGAALLATFVAGGAEEVAGLGRTVTKAETGDEIATWSIGIDIETNEAESASESETGTESGTESEIESEIESESGTGIGIGTGGICETSDPAARHLGEDEHLHGTFEIENEMVPR